MRELRRLTMWATVLVATACVRTTPFPWPEHGQRAELEHVEVATHGSYDRNTSHVLIRTVARPTRANLDFAAYHANVLIADLPPEFMPAGQIVVPDAPFDGMLPSSTVVTSLGETGLSEDERGRPLAFEPMVARLASKGWGGGLEDLQAAVRSESWGQQSGPQWVRQRITVAFLHAGEHPLWVRIEVEPWFTAFAELPDEDGDGFPEIYAPVPATLIEPDALAFLRGEYTTRELSADEIRGWANELASYWYPSYNTDIVDAGPGWPDDQTEPEIVKEAGGAQVTPAAIIRGKPHDKPLYQVFVVGGVGGEAAATHAAAGDSSAPRAATADTTTLSNALEREAKAHGSWDTWRTELETFRKVLANRLKKRPETLKALEGGDGFLFFRRSLEQAVAGDLRQQRDGRDPLPAIVEFKDLLAEHGVDLLFVPVPTKLEIYPDRFAPELKKWTGEVVTPHVRKLMLELNQAGVEVLDLYAPYLTRRRGAGNELIYQVQDTHWTAFGMMVAAEVVAERVQRYPWFGDLPKGASYTTTVQTVTQYGDLHSRLADREKRNYKPVALQLAQVLDAEGRVYDDDPDSPVVVLGDSFTGVFQRTPPRGAGFSAQLAQSLGMPVDLVMSYGGGANVRKKLMKRGEDYLDGIRLVVWVMAARDLYAYHEPWARLRE